MARDGETVWSRAQIGTIELLASNRGSMHTHFQTSPRLPWAMGYWDDSLLICAVRSGTSRELLSEAQR